VSCPARPALLALSRNPTELEAQRCGTMQDIRSIFAQAQVYPRNATQQIRIGSCGPPSYRTLSLETRIIELDIAEIMLNYPGAPPMIRGLYDVATGKTILCRGNWCRETLIHETLHSFSFGSVRPDLGRRYVNFFEGLTEFFSGYIMSIKYPDCYRAWKEQKHRECSVTYIPFVRLWAAFCRFIRIQELLLIYFWDGTTYWEKKCADFTEAIHQAGYPDFDNFRNRPLPTVEAKIQEECLKNFGRVHFKNIYESPLPELLDFNQVLH